MNINIAYIHKTTDNKLYMKVSDNHIHVLLGQAGLSQSERDVYLAGIGLGETTSAKIIKTTGMPRPTVLAALRVLADNELCETKQLDGRSYSYAMLPIANLKSIIGRKIRQLDEVMNQLDNVNLQSPDTTAVREASGHKEVQDLLELALRCRSRHWQIIAPYDNALRRMPVEYISYFKRIRASRQIESQTLWEFDSSQRQVSLQDVLMRKPRFVPQGISPVIPSLMLCFDDCLLTIDLGEAGDMSAVLIENAGTAATFRVVFEMAWRAAR